MEICIQKGRKVAIPNKKPKFLGNLALAIFKGEVFTSFHLDLKRREDLFSVFTVFLLMEKTEFKKMGDDVGMVYEYLSKASPMVVNGMPTFLSAQVLNTHDTTIVWDLVRELEVASLNVLGKAEVSNAEKV
jgi:hypothetical protein